MLKLRAPLFILILSLSFLAGKSPKASIDNASEKHLKNLRQLTFGGDNAEAYFSPDGKMLTFQSNFKKWNLSCDQIFMMKISEARDSSYLPARISTSGGRDRRNT